MIEKETRVAKIIDVAIPNDANITRKRLEKIRSYTDMAVEIKQLWNLSNVKIMPVIIGACGAVYKNLDDDLQHLDIKKFLPSAKPKK